MLAVASLLAQSFRSLSVESGLAVIRFGAPSMIAVPLDIV